MPVLDKPLPKVGVVAVILPDTDGVVDEVNVHVAFAACPKLILLKLTKAKMRSKTILLPGVVEFEKEKHFSCKIPCKGFVNKFLVI